MVIGAAGFVGNYLIDAIKELLFCDVCATKLEREKPWRDDVEIVDLNILDPEAIYSLLIEKNPKYVFHLAAQSSIAYAWKNPAMTVETNVKGALNLFNAVRRLKTPPRVLVVGSGEEYGFINPDDVPINETSPLRPGNIYAATKICQNMMAAIYNHAYGLPLIMVRAFNHFGPKQAPQFVASDFCRQVAMIEAGLQPPLMKVGNLEARRDFTDVRDVVRAYVRLVLFGVPGETYNVGSGKAVRIQELLDTILSCTEMSITVERDPDRLRPSDVPVIEADTKKIYNAVGWRPVISLKQTVQDTLDYWREEIRRENAGSDK